MRVFTYPPPDFEFGRAIIHVVVVVYIWSIIFIMRFPWAIRHAWQQAGVNNVKTCVKRRDPDKCVWSMFVARAKEFNVGPLHGWNEILKCICVVRKWLGKRSNARTKRTRHVLYNPLLMAQRGGAACQNDEQQYRDSYAPCDSFAVVLQSVNTATTRPIGSSAIS